MSRNVTRLVLNPVAACAARCRRMLDALGRLGKRRMGGLRPSPGAASVAAAASAFGRMTRALRLITLLDLRLRALLTRGPAEPIGAVPHPASPEAENVDREPIDRPERLDRESPDRERFPKFDLGKFLAEDARPLAELAAAVCRELGLSKEATLRAQAPFAELEALLAGKAPPPKPARRPSSMDREPPGSPLLRNTEPSDAKRASLEARGPKKPP